MRKQAVYLNNFATKGGFRLQFLRQSACYTHHCLRGLTSPMTHHRPLVRGDDYALISSDLSGEKRLLSFTLWPVLINGWCIGYMLADDSCMNRTRWGFMELTFI